MLEDSIKASEGNSAEPNRGGLPFHWKDQQGNKYRVNPTRAMLQSEGVVYAQRTRIVGEDKESIPGLFRPFRYDKEYVIEWLAKKVFNRFKGMKWNDIQAILSEAYKQSQRENGDKT